jgi:DNA polymerase III epsilon subunit
MHTKQKILLWFFIVILLPVIFFTSGTIGFWFQLEPFEQVFIVKLIRAHAAYIYISISLFLFIMVYIAKWIFLSYFIPLKKLTEDTSILSQASHSKPITTKGGRELQNLAQMINLLSQKHKADSGGYKDPGKHIGDRPEVYEFDLFKHGSGYDDLENIPLSELRYVVFDTETSGLNPNDGDEIISIGAVRLMNRKILWDNQFNALINPQRKISEASEKITGITRKHLQNKPLIDEVLPDFHSFTKNSVLVGHNIAFDMQFIKLKEQELNLKFDNPTLDTLLLSAIVHPFQESHSLEAIAERFGISLINRHTALGDAIITAEIFIKLLNLLKGKGIYTLRQAADASQKTYYARIKY